MALLIWSSLESQRLEPNILVLIYRNVHFPLTTEGGTRRQGPVIAAFKSPIWGNRGGGWGWLKLFYSCSGSSGVFLIPRMWISALRKVKKKKGKFCCNLIITSGQAYLYLRVVRLADMCLSCHQNTRVLPATSNTPISPLEPRIKFQKLSTVASVATMGHYTRTCLRRKKKMNQSHVLSPARVFPHNLWSLVTLAALWIPSRNWSSPGAEAVADYEADKFVGPPKLSPRSIHSETKHPKNAWWSE